MWQPSAAEHDGGDRDASARVRIAAAALVQEEQKRVAALLPLLEETPSEAGLALSEAIRARLDLAACGARRLAT